jgi:adenine deaminase
MTIRLHPSLDDMKCLAAVARGDAQADLVVSGGSLVDVFTEELLDGWGLAVARGRVAYIGPEAGRRAGPATERLDLDGDLVTPGLIEGHTHLTRLRLSDMADLQIRAGTTTTIVEASEHAFVLGPAGVREVLRAAALLPARLYFTIPTLLNPDPDYDARIAPAEEWIELFDHPGVAGVGEIYWADLLRGHERAEAMLAAALERGLPVEGHGAGARFDSLNALAAFGVSSDHEAIDAEGILTRLRLGLHTLAREGATRQDLEAIAPAWKSGADMSRLGLITDGVEPEDAMRADSLNLVVERALAQGLALPRAVRMASRTVAEHFGLGRWLGGLAPAMLADFAVLPREGGGFRPRQVRVGGTRPDPAAPPQYPAWMLETVRLDGYDPALLERPASGRWRAMELTGPLVAKETESNGSDDLVATVIDRTGHRRGFRGLLRNFGMREGAVAISSGWECPGVTVVGENAADMALAVARVREIRGGAAVARGSRLLAEWRAPVAGLYGTGTAEEVLSEVRAVNGALHELGCWMPNPLLTLETLTTAAIPHVRLWAGGYYRLRDGVYLGLEWEEG